MNKSVLEENMCLLARAAEPVSEDFLTVVKCLGDIFPAMVQKEGNGRGGRLGLTRRASIDPANGQWSLDS
jgi:hypothetical protein